MQINLHFLRLSFKGAYHAHRVLDGDCGRQPLNLQLLGASVCEAVKIEYTVMVMQNCRSSQVTSFRVTLSPSCGAKEIYA